MSSLACVDQLVECYPMHQKDAGSISGREHAWVVGSIIRCVQEATNQSIYLTSTFLSLSFPSSLSRLTKNIFKKFNCPVFLSKPENLAINIGFSFLHGDSQLELRVHCHHQWVWLLQVFIQSPSSPGSTCFTYLPCLVSKAMELLLPGINSYICRVIRASGSENVVENTMNNECKIINSQICIY